MENSEGREIQSKDYALSGKIMLIAIVLLFLVIVIMLCLHVYVRCRIVAARRRQFIRRAPRRPQFVFYVDPAARIGLTTRGLHPSVISTLPVFTFSEGSDARECSVCLSELEEGERGRVLPKCNHTFHTDCIDMWFQSHATCPLCRAPVEAQPKDPLLLSASASASASGPGPQQVLGPNSSSSSESPVSRILSFKIILSREKKESASISEFDAERGECDSASLTASH
ncbi:RING-H2 finger protein ATL2 [Cajanus cajan]|uniref:RING-type E3 ubiquitin transferase n=1 Tax=Cajanus cajan TaxID=3821 RepID=A0A151STN1_CAJCA|nr:RING-H2 finger protein ATL2 [Cajanus cajan]KYP58121.1 RING-H2 finger protein ATL3F [Cajanus cajan]